MILINQNIKQTDTFYNVKNSYCLHNKTCRHLNQCVRFTMGTKL